MTLIIFFYEINPLEIENYKSKMGLHPQYFQNKDCQYTKKSSRCLDVELIA